MLSILYYIEKWAYLRLANKRITKYNNYKKITIIRNLKWLVKKFGEILKKFFE